MNNAAFFADRINEKKQGERGAYKYIEEDKGLT